MVSLVPYINLEIKKYLSTIYSILAAPPLTQCHHYVLTFSSGTTEQIQRLQKQSGVDHDFSIFWVSRRTLVSNKILEEAGVLGDISIEELPLHFIPYEDDVLNLALEDAFEDLYLVCPRVLFRCCISLTSLHSEKTRHASSSQRRLSCHCNTPMASSPVSSERDRTRND